MKLIRYNDLVAKGVVASRMTLWRLIREHNFPEGKLIAPNARAWDEAEVDEWIAGRPTAPALEAAVESSTGDCVSDGRKWKPGPAGGRPGSECALLGG